MNQQYVCELAFREKYAKTNETTHADVFRRVARGLAEVEKPEDRQKYEELFFDNMMNGALGAGRIMSAAGTGIEATLINCFVQPVGDCTSGIQNGKPGIYDALAKAAETMRRGGGVGYNFSRIRPKGAKVKSTHSEASGPCSYINVFNESCETVESAGARRGAQMAILNISHPDIFAFITAKQTKGRWNNFNISVGVVDGFMDALQSGGMWDLVHEAEPGVDLVKKGAYQRADGMWVYRQVPANEIWDTIMESTYACAEPGVVFLDNMNRDNNLRYCEVIEATNPCGEQPLPDYGCCDLGPTDLTRFVQSPFEATAKFDFESLSYRVSVLTRMLDNVLTATLWPLPEQQREANDKRRIGVGLTGLGDTLVMLGLRYDTDAGREMARKIVETMRNSAYRASIELAKERGPFTLFNADEYLAEGTSASRLPDDIKSDIRKFGIRNSHLTSIAPAGTTSLAFCDNVSNGIEPAFSWAYTRTKRMPDGTKDTFPIEDHALRVYLDWYSARGEREAAIAAAVRGALSSSKPVAEIPEYGIKVNVKEFLPASFVSALEMSAIDHMEMLRVVQPYVDSAISKTVNIPEDYPFEDFKDLYLQAWKAGLKGLATYRPNSVVGAVLQTGSSAPQSETVASVKSDVDPLKVVLERRPPGAMPAESEKIQFWSPGFGKKSIFVVMSFMKVNGVIDGKDVTIERPIEFFIPAGQLDESQQWVTASMRTLSLAARGGFVAKALQDMTKVTWDRGQIDYGRKEKLTGESVPVKHNSEVAVVAYALQQALYRRGFLDVDGNQVPAKVLVKQSQGEMIETEPVVEQGEVSMVAPAAYSTGKRCPECNANALVPRDGCMSCQACGHIGSCG